MAPAPSSSARHSYHSGIDLVTTTWCSGSSDSWGLPYIWGCMVRRVFSRLFSHRGGCVAWIVRLVRTGDGGEEQCTDVMQMNRRDDLVDIADLRLQLG
jgi:hypothetical protein